MSSLGIRDRVKSGIKKALGIEPPAAPPPVRQSPFASRAEPDTPAFVPEPGPEPADALADPPAAATPAAGTISLEALQEVLDDMVRPALQGDGGDIHLVKIEGNDVHVRLVGACGTCPSSIMTMKMGVESLLREEFPQIGEIVQVA